MNTELLPIAVPPMLEAALGYEGNARLVAFYWTAGDEASYDDGEVCAMCEGDAFLTFVRHPAVAPVLHGYDFGSGQAEAQYWLLLDRELRQLSATPVEAARRTLQAQWKPLPTAQRLGVDEAGFAHMIYEIDHELNSITPDIIWALKHRHRQLVQGLEIWLGEHLPQPRLRYELVPWAADPEALWVQDRASNLAIFPPPSVKAEPLRVGTPDPWSDALSPHVAAWDRKILGKSTFLEMMSQYRLELIYPPLRCFDPARGGYFVSHDHPEMKL